MPAMLARSPACLLSLRGGDNIIVEGPHLLMPEPRHCRWMTGFGFRYADVLSFEVGLNTNVDWDVVPGE